MVNENLYYLMHENDIVCLLFMDEVSGRIMKTGTKVNQELLPLGGNQSQQELKKWWDRRAVPVDQGNMKRILEQNGIFNTQSYLLRNLGVSLIDHYWINPVDEMIEWKDINLFENEFKDEIAEMQFGDDYSNAEDVLNLCGQTHFYPSSTTQGELKKKWIIKDGIRYLVKGNYGTSYQQSINEVIASAFHKKQNRMPYTEYQLCDISTKNEPGLGCICKGFASVDKEFVSGYDVVCSRKKRNDISEYEHFIKICVDHGLKENEVREFLEYQILSDFILTNTDRHFNNFGILRDSKSLKFVGMAPLFDTGNSMFWKRPSEAEGDLCNISVNSFKKREIDLLKYVTNPEVIDRSKLLDVKDIDEFLKNDIDYTNRGELIIKGYEQKVELLEKFQKGEKIYQKNFKKDKLL